MALIQCAECAKEISDKAATCPHCGAPVIRQVAAPAKPSPANPLKQNLDKKTIFLGLIFGVGFVGYLASCESKNDQPGAPSAAVPAKIAEPPPCPKDDLKCNGENGLTAANVYCVRPIEKLAKFDVKWTDRTFESKFDRYAWKDKAAGSINYIGDKAQFQNGFGAYAVVTYVCTIAKDGKTILDVRVAQGRLPN